MKVTNFCVYAGSEVRTRQNIFALATDFFFKVGPQGWVGWEDASSPPRFLERVFSVLNKGETKKRRKKKIVNEQTVGKGGGRPGGTTEKEKKGDREVGILRRMLRVLSGVARGSHSGRHRGRREWQRRARPAWRSPYRKGSTPTPAQLPSSPGNFRSKMYRRST